MKNTSTITFGGLLVVALPLVMAAGCTTNRSDVAAGYTTDKVVIQEDQKPDTQAPPVSNATAGDMAQQITEEGGNEVTQGDSIETAQAQQSVTQVGQEAEDDVVEETLSEPAVARIDASPAATDDSTSQPVPRQRVFYFASDSDQPLAEDYAALILHAAYLQQHPNMVLLISGHADSRGPQLYNERLSAKRARNVAAILLAAGVSDSQLQIDAVGETASDPSHWRENRRVEFFYHDTMMAQY